MIAPSSSIKLILWKPHYEIWIHEVPLATLTEYIDATNRGLQTEYKNTRRESEREID